MYRDQASVQILEGREVGMWPKGMAGISGVNVSANQGRGAMRALGYKVWAGASTYLSLPLFL